MDTKTVLFTVAKEYGVDWSLGLIQDPDHPHYGLWVVDVDAPGANGQFADGNADRALEKAARWAVDALESDALRRVQREQSRFLEIQRLGLAGTP